MLARFWTRLLMVQYLAQISTSSGPGSEVGLDNRPPAGHALPRDVGRLCWCRSSLGPLGRSGRRERRRNSEERGDQVRISCGAFDEMFESNSEPGWPSVANWPWAAVDAVNWATRKGASRAGLVPGSTEAAVCATLCHRVRQFTGHGPHVQK